MTRICVFCGSSSGGRPAYTDAARELGTALARRGIGLVYGGGSVGLMGVIADAVLAAGGEVIGVIPGGLASRELAHAGLTEQRVVGSMHERKATMASLADAFVALPGGLGTLEETLEMLTWVQLGIHDKPVVVLNVDGYFDGLLKMFATAVREGFLRREYFELLVFGDTVPEVLDRIATWQTPAVRRAWLRPSEI
jgi:uncharacterized protein (TIGR00730 family)